MNHRVQAFGIAGLQMPMPLQKPFAPMMSTEQVMWSPSVHGVVHIWIADIMNRWQFPSEQSLSPMHESYVAPVHTSREGASTSIGGASTSVRGVDPPEQASSNTARSQRIESS
jgi:hypothetical protein